MTVSTEISSNEYTGNGVTTDFDYKFRIFKANQLSVITSDSDGDNVVTLRLGTDYTVTGANKSAGGKVILTKPLANGHKISIARDIPITQETSFRNQSKFLAETHEDAFDYLTMILQRIWGSLGSLYLKRPNILANWFDAKGYRIANLGKPKRDSDAVDLGTMKDEIEVVNSTVLKREKRLLRVDDMDIAAFPKATERRNKQIGFDNSGSPTLLDPVETGALGYVLVDSFEKGAVITGRFQALFWEEKREYFRFDGPLPKTVPPLSTPETTGGIKTNENPNGLWVSVGDASLRNELPRLIGDITNYQAANVGDMLEGKTISKNKISLAIGQVWSTGGTQWKLTSDSTPITIDNFRAFNCINGCDFGMKGDGVTDNTIPFQNAINSLKGKPKGGVVFLPRGVYVISDSININRDAGDGVNYPSVPAMGLDNITIEGESKSGDYLTQEWGTTIKQINPDKNGLWFFGYTTSPKVRFLQVIGAKTGVKFDNCLFFELSSTSLMRNEYGCEVWGNGVGNVFGNKIRENFKFGLALYASSGDTLVQGNDIGRQGYGKSGSYQSANVYISSGGIRLINNLIFTCRNTENSHGVIIAGRNEVDPDNGKIYRADTDLQYVIIENNLIAANKKALTVRGGTLSSPKVNDLHIVRNSFKAGETIEEREDRLGVDLTHVKFFSISENHFSGFKLSGLHITGALRCGDIFHNRFYNNQGNGITCDLAKFVNISSNFFESNDGIDVEIKNTINTGDYSQNNTISENAFLGGSLAKYKEGEHVRRNNLYSNKGATFAELKSGLNESGIDTTLVSHENGDTSAFSGNLLVDKNIRSEKLVIARNGLAVGNAENKAVGDAKNKRVEVFDINGESIGYIQLFDA
ncbi:glycosyl hydrolase family 28-related protein [Providencia rettgeri]|uniref:glycosyl hydrolase family 28-related protein n=1 Tax=Providencia rettgeri TaxID=587 RepID=UPI0030100178